MFGREPLREEFHGAGASAGPEGPDRTEEEKRTESVAEPQQRQRADHEEEVLSQEAEAGSTLANKGSGPPGLGPASEQQQGPAQSPTGEKSGSKECARESRSEETERARHGGVLVAYQKAEQVQEEPRWKGDPRRRGDTQHRSKWATTPPAFLSQGKGQSGELKAKAPRDYGRRQREPIRLLMNCVYWICLVDGL